jgi:hypothetical protein
VKRAKDRALRPAPRPVPQSVRDQQKRSAEAFAAIAAWLTANPQLINRQQILAAAPGDQLIQTFFGGATEELPGFARQRGREPNGR